MKLQEKHFVGILATGTLLVMTPHASTLLVEYVKNL